MAASWQASVRTVAEEIMLARAVPGMVVAVARGEERPECLALGVDHRGRPLAEDSLLPVASITKLATALAVLRLADRGALGLDDPLARHLPEADAAREGVTPRRLLSHTAGLPDDVPPEAAPYTLALDWPTLARSCMVTVPVAPPGTQVSYSNVGPGLLAIVVERLTGRRFGEAVNELVLRPLGIEGYLGQEPPRTVSWIAGDLGEHTGTDLDPYNSPFWRTLALPWGGLVTTAAGALALARAFAGHPPGFLSDEILAEARRDQTGGLAGRMVFFEWPRCPWGLGVELRGDKAPHWTPADASSTSFGHVGASGCIAWVDRSAEVAWAMLGARFFMDWWEDWPTIGAAILAARR
jgi:CubicO group peptidase (beta-lactamase class C family)